MNGGHGSLDIDAAITRLAARQHGLLTVRQSASLGIDRSALHRRRRSGFLEAVRPGVMRVTSSPPFELQDALAAALAVPGSVVAGPPAGRVDGLPVGRLGSPVLLVPSERMPRVPGVVVVRSGITLPSRPWAGARVTSSSATLVTLARFVTPPVLERCIDHALAHRLTTVPVLRSLVESLPPQAVPGRPLLLDLLTVRADGPRHRSALEQKVARWLSAAGLGGWQANLEVPVVGGAAIECDFVWSPVRAILEVSPFFTHGSRATQQRDVERRRLLVESGWRIVEATDAHLVDRSAFDVCIGSLRRLGVGRPAPGR